MLKICEQRSTINQRFLTRIVEMSTGPCMKFNYLDITIDSSGVATITLNRPETHNAFNDVMVHELITALESLNQLDNIGVILLTAEGKSFSAGADLAWMQQMVQFDHAQNVTDITALARLMQVLYTSPKITIALVQGPTYGGGIGLVACCDIAIASKHAYFCFSEVKLGLIPSVISPYVVQAIGPRQAKWYFLTAEIIDSPTSSTIGLTHEIVEHTELFARGYQLAGEILHHGKEVINATKSLMLAISNPSHNPSLIQKTVETLQHFVFRKMHRCD